MTAGSGMDVSVVAPALDEEENLPALVQRTFAAVGNAGLTGELVVVLDGGTDGSLELLVGMRGAYPKLRIVQLAPNTGQHSAVFEGLKLCSGRHVVTIDSDLQNPPEAVPEIVKLLQGGCDAVGTIRMRREDPVHRTVASRVFGLSLAVMRARHTMTDPGCMLRGWTADVVQRFLASGQSPWYLPLQLNQLASTYAELETGHNSRQLGESRYGALQLAGLYLAAWRGRFAPATPRPLVPEVVSTHGFRPDPGERP